MKNNTSLAFYERTCEPGCETVICAYELDSEPHYFYTLKHRELAIDEFIEDLAYDYYSGTLYDVSEIAQMTADEREDVLRAYELSARLFAGKFTAQRIANTLYIHY